MTTTPFPHLDHDRIGRGLASLGWPTRPGADGRHHVATTDIARFPELRFGRLDGSPALLVMRFPAAPQPIRDQLPLGLLAANEWNRRSPLLRAHLRRSGSDARWVLDATTVWTADGPAIEQFLTTVVAGVRAFAANPDVPLLA